MGSPMKPPPKIHRTDPSGPTQMAASVAEDGSTQKLTTGDALTYLKAVKEMFQDKREKYEEFLEVMKDFKSQRIDTSGVIAKVKELFKGHHELILGFNTFLPKGYEIKFHEEKKPVEFTEAIGFVNKIKNRFQGNDGVYKSFLDILNMYRRDIKNIHEVYREVAILLQDHDDLLEEFTHFLPDTSVTVAQHASSGRTFMRREDKSSVKHPHLVGGKERAYVRDLSVDRPNSEHDRQRQRSDKYRKEERDKRDPEPDEDLEHGIRDLNNVSRKYIKSSRREDNSCTEQMHQSGEGGEYIKEFKFCEKLKEKLHADAYEEFLKCLDIYSKEIINRSELKNLVGDILKKYPDLMSNFKEFLAHCENIDGFLAGVFSKKALWNGGHIARSVKIENGNREREHERDEMERNNGKERDRERERTDKGAAFVSKDASSHKVSLLSNKEKYNSCKPVSELDLSDCQRCTPSYCLLPKHHSLPPASHRTELGASVLNDVWVSVTSGSEDYSFKHMRKNQYEESIFRCEDDRFELDMLLESMNVTTKRVEELIGKIQDNTITAESPICIEDHFTSVNLKCIEKLYGDHGLDAMDTLRKNANLALPIILTRLKQKQEEWLRCRSDYNRVWADIYAKNHHKSLDHRSFYFKQQDSKSWSPKALLAEIKEIGEKKQDDNVLLALSAADQQTIVPNMEFEYIDSQIHEDLYQLIKCSCREVCTSPDEVDKVMRIWTSFLEPVLGIRPHPEGVEDAEDAVKTKGTTVKSGVAWGNNGSSGAVVVVANIKPNNGYDSTLPEQAKSCRVRLANLDTAVTGNDFHNSDTAACQSDNLCSTLLQERVQNNAKMADEMCRDTIQTASTQQSPNIITSAGKGDQRHNRFIPEVTAGLSATPSKSGRIGTDTVLEPCFSNEVLPSEGGDDMRPMIPANSGCKTGNNKVHKSHEGSGTHNNFQVEREEGELEEGELSPNGDSEEDNFITFEDASMEVVSSEVKDNSASTQYQARLGEEICCETTGENDTIADNEGEENVQRSTEGSENASEADAHVLGSASAEGEEHSRGHYVVEDTNHNDRDAKTESYLQSEEMTDANDVEGETSSLPFSKCVLHTVKPLVTLVPPPSHDKENKSTQIFYGNDSFYVLFRLHQILYERILLAKLNSSTAERKWRSSKDTNRPSFYAKFLGALYNLIDGSADNTKFEEDCYSIIGTQSYVLFTLDKLIARIVKQLQVVASDEMENKLFHLYIYENSRRPERFSDKVYHGNARALLHEESIYRFECSCSPTRLSIQLMEYIDEKPDTSAVSMDPDFTAYLYNEFLSNAPDEKETNDVFLRRNKRKFETDDDFRQTEGIHLLNGLDYKISCDDSKIRKISYTA